MRTRATSSWRRPLVRDEGTTRQYVPEAFPAVADLDVTAALRDGLRESGLRHHVGVVQSKDSFYGQRQRERMPVSGELQERWDAWIRAGALCSEMEAAAIFVVSSVLRAGPERSSSSPETRRSTPREDTAATQSSRR